MYNWTVDLRDGTKDHVIAKSVDIDHGHLVFKDEQGTVIRGYNGNLFMHFDRNSKAEH